MPNSPECPFKNICTIFRGYINTGIETADLKQAVEALKERLKLQKEISGEKKHTEEVDDG